MAHRGGETPAVGLRSRLGGRKGYRVFERDTSEHAHAYGSWGTYEVSQHVESLHAMATRTLRVPRGECVRIGLSCSRGRLGSVARETGERTRERRLGQKVAIAGSWTGSRG